MLNQYRRHTTKCIKKYDQHDRSHNGCKCMIYVEGRLNRGSEYLKQSTGTRNWERVRQMIVAAENRGSWQASASLPALSVGEQTAADEKSRAQTVTGAIGCFLEEAVSEKGRNLAPATFGKYKTLLGRLREFCADRGLIALNEITLTELLGFKRTWSTRSRATKNNIQRLRSFFRFCTQIDWISENPAKKLEMPKNIKCTQKMPYTTEEMSRILQAAQTIKLNVQQPVNNLDLYAFVLTMRYTGLRISDTGLLTADRLQGDQLFLYAKKNGALVYCPLLPWVAEVLRNISLKKGRYFFCTGSTRLQTVVELWSKRLRQVFVAAGIQNGTSHRFRHTFAVSLLENGVDVKHVSMLLGHESVLTTEEHYSAWIQARQDALNLDVMRAYERSNCQNHARRPAL